MHKPVLLEEVIGHLNPQTGMNFIDCTVGRGGHLKSILKKIGKEGKILGLDADSQSLKEIKLKFAKEKRVTFKEGNFRNLEKIVKEAKFESVDGILFDLGFSSWQLEESKRGFSFRKDEPLKMSFNTKQKLKADEIINEWPLEDLVKIFTEYGEEKFGWRIAKRIISLREEKRIATTLELEEIIKRAIPFSQTRRGQSQRVAARIFQSLRIVVNDELESLTKGLKQAFKILKPGGRLVVISFHSLEDRIVKRFFKDKQKKDLLTILTKRPVVSTKGELEDNPRGRSAKLRASIKI